MTGCQPESCAIRATLCPPHGREFTFNRLLLRSSRRLSRPTHAHRGRQGTSVRPQSAPPRSRQATIDAHQLLFGPIRWKSIHRAARHPLRSWEEQWAIIRRQKTLRHFPLPFAMVRHPRARRAGIAGRLAVLARASGSPPETWALSLPGIYAAWDVVLDFLYTWCRWFAGVKARHPGGRLSYL